MSTRTYAKVRTEIWANDDFRKLDARGQRLYFALLTTSSLNWAGIADWRPSRLSALCGGETVKSIRDTARKLEATRFVYVDESTEEALIRTFIRNDEVFKSPKLTIASCRQLAEIASPRLKEIAVYEARRCIRDFPDWKGIPYVPGWVIDTVSETLSGRVSDTPTDTPTDTHPKTMPIPIPYPNPYTQAEKSQEKGAMRPEDDPAFLAFWAHYPRKDDRLKAFKAWNTALKVTDAETLTKAAKAYSVEVEGREKKFIKLGSSWLNAGSWENDYTAVPAPSQEMSWEQKRMAAIPFVTDEEDDR